MTNKDYMRDWYSQNKDLVKLQKKVCKGCGRNPRGRRCKDWEFCVARYKETLQQATPPPPPPQPHTTTLTNSARNPVVFRMITDDGVCPSDALFYIADTLRDLVKEIQTTNRLLESIRDKV